MHSHELLSILSLLGAESLSRINLPDLTGEGDGSEPGTYLLRGMELVKLREQIRSGDELLGEGYKTLLELANKACMIKPMSVCDKEVAAPGGTVNDYCSLARYAWPSPDATDGMPYVLRDGDVYPETYDQKRYDASRLESFASTLFLLSIAHYRSGERKYGVAAAEQLRRWFVDSESRQTPHFRFAQIVPGKDKLRGIGIVEARRYLYVIDAEALIAECDAWGSADRTEFRRWFADFFAWLRTSEQGAHAASQKNNIGLWYDLQCAIYALFLGERRLAEVILRESHPRRLAEQVDLEGGQPGEMLRAQPYDYVLFNLLAMMGLARAGELAGFESLWTDSSDGRSFQRALDWLLSVVRSKDDPDAGANNLLSLLELKKETLGAAERLQEQRELFESAPQRLAIEVTKREAVSKALASMKEAFEAERKSLEDERDAAREELAKYAAELEKVKQQLIEESALRQEAADLVNQQRSQVKGLSQELRRAQKLAVDYHALLRD